MTTTNTPDPYNGFKRDEERRRALNVLAISKAASEIVAAMSAALKGMAIAAVALLLATNPQIPKSALLWLRTLL